MRIKTLIITTTFVLLLAFGALALWFLVPWPVTPAHERIDEQFDYQVYDQSMPAKAGSPAVMILGTTHLTQADSPYDEAALERIAEGMADYAPDLVAVEYLGPQYPDGAGRDYRPDLDPDALSEQWNLGREEAASLVRANRRGDPVDDSCRLAKAYFLHRDYMNGLYHWPAGECDALQEQEDIQEWAEHYRQHEAAVFGFHAARSSDLREVVPFDYQGADAEWFLHGMLQEAVEERDITRIWALRDMLPRVGRMNRFNQAHYEPVENDIIDYLRLMNSPHHIAHQYWLYEEMMPTITLENAGARQTENYWRRNQKMFGYLQDAIERKETERVLIIVGSGHKYFLDELTREAGYRWIDPREWLPESVDDET